MQERDSATRSRLAGGLFALVFAVAEVKAGGSDTRDDGAAGSWFGSEWTEVRLHTSVLTHHFDPDPNHVDDQHLIGIEAHRDNDWLVGFAWFRNSFGQPSQYAFIGRQGDILGSPHWYWKLSGGLLHGYDGAYQDKIPLNDLGIAPAILPAVGFRYGPLVLEASLGGAAVVLLTAGLAF
jgi:hypothetical protein